MLWVLKTARLLDARTTSTSATREVQIHALDYFVHRDVALKISEEQQMDDAEAQVLNLPFKMKVQSIMDDNKAIDERTAQDKAEAEKAAALEIEANFPSYFDELSKQLLSITATNTDNWAGSDQKNLDYKPRPVAIDKVLSELVEVSSSEEPVYRTEWLRLRLQCMGMDVEQCETLLLPSAQPVSIRVPEVLEGFVESDKEWMEDAICCLEDQI